MISIDSLRKLTDECAAASYAYYVADDPIMSDLAYDILYDKLQKAEEEAGVVLSNSPTQCVQGEATNSFAKVKHIRPMLSASKTKEMADVTVFAGDHPVQVSWKLDGLTAVATYKKGQLVQVATRGDGEIGEDVTANAKRLMNLPLQLERPVDLVIRGEVLCPVEAFNTYNASQAMEWQFTTMRSMAAGGLRNQNPMAVYERGLRIVIFDLVDVTDETLADIMLNDEARENWNKELQLEYLAQLGFETVERVPNIQADAIEETIQWFSERREAYKYPTDGLVIEYENTEYGLSLGATAHHENRLLAFKWTDNAVETIFRGVEYDVTRYGRVSLVAVFDPVEIEQSTVQRAQIYNCEDFETKQFGVGDTITVYKANAITPHIAENLTCSGTYELNTTCPCCGKQLVRKTESEQGIATQLFCVNAHCKETLIKRIVYFASKDGLNIKGLARQTVERLVDAGFVSAIDDLYRLYNYEAELCKVKGFGKDFVKNMLESIQASRSCNMWRFINGLSIYRFGKSAARRLDWYYKGDFFALFEDARNKRDFTCIQGITEADNKLLHQWFASPHPYVNVERMMYYLDFIREEFDPLEMEGPLPSSPFYGKNVVVTGVMTKWSREEIEEQLRKIGARVRTTVSTKTDFVLAGDHSGTKRVRAAELGIPILYEDEFIQMLGELEI